MKLYVNKREVWIGFRRETLQRRLLVQPLPCLGIAFESPRVVLRRRGRHIRGVSKPLPRPRSSPVQTIASGLPPLVKEDRWDGGVELSTGDPGWVVARLERFVPTVIGAGGHVHFHARTLRSTLHGVARVRVTLCYCEVRVSIPRATRMFLWWYAGLDPKTNTRRGITNAELHDTILTRVIDDLGGLVHPAPPLRKRIVRALWPRMRPRPLAIDRAAVLGALRALHFNRVGRGG